MRAAARERGWGPLFDPPSADDPGGDQAEVHVCTVTELTRSIKQCLEDQFGHVWLSGEISNARTPQSGHVYMTLKDENAQISAVMFRQVAQYVRFRLEDGLAVTVYGRVSVYEPRGSYQIIVERIEPKGEGALQLAFRQLMERLEKEGLFDPAHKKPLPSLPRRIGIVTSPTGAAIHDMLNVILDRFPLAQIVLRPVRVQGDGAGEEIAEAIADLDAHGRVDVMIVGRGGGSLEDLWAFNEEVTARAIWACTTPVISAVGHEIDVTIADMVADCRALTPTAAGELVVPELSALLDSLGTLKHRLGRALLARLEVAKGRVAALSRSYALSRPLDFIRQRQQRVDDLGQRAQVAAANVVALSKERSAALGARLEALSPLAVLARGYSVTRTSDERTVTDAAALLPQDSIVTMLHKGSVESVVSRVCPAKEHEPGKGDQP